MTDDLDREFNDFVNGVVVDEKTSPKPTEDAPKAEAVNDMLEHLRQLQEEQRKDAQRKKTWDELFPYRGHEYRPIQRPGGNPWRKPR